MEIIGNTARSDDELFVKIKLSAYQRYQITSSKYRLLTKAWKAIFTVANATLLENWDTRYSPIGRYFKTDANNKYFFKATLQTCRFPEFKRWRVWTQSIYAYCAKRKWVFYFSLKELGVKMKQKTSFGQMKCLMIVVYDRFRLIGKKRLIDRPIIIGNTPIWSVS